MKHPDTQKTLQFGELLHAFQRVERVVHVPKQDRYENDAEHSYILAMLAWYLVDALALPLNKQKIFSYALAHDLVEVYAGDTYAFTKDENAKNTKHQREEESRKQIEREFPEFPDLHNTIIAYEAQADEESKFVHALDKLAPLVTIYLQDGRTWKEMEVSFDLIYTNKRERVKNHPELKTLFESIIALIETDRSRYFNL